MMNWFNLEDNINLLTIIASAALLILTIAVPAIYFRQMKNTKNTGELLDEKWDDIKEYSNGIPIGWALSFIAVSAWAIWYFLIGYPTNSYSQIGEYNEEVSLYNEKFQAKWAKRDEVTLKAMGESIFLVQCAPCHGILGDGMNSKAADLTQWGHEEGIVNVIMNGSAGLNYPMGAMEPKLLNTEDEARAVAAFVMKEISVVGKTRYPELVEKGRELWQTCTACHNDDGKGMDGMSPDLTQYGTVEFASRVLSSGKKGLIGNMPSFDDGRLSDIQKEAVSTYILSLTDK